MSDNIFQQYLAEKDIEYKLTTDQFHIKTCHNCGDEKWHVYMNVFNGLNDCKKCGFQANFNDYRRLFNDPPIKHEEQLVSRKRTKVYENMAPDLARQHLSRLLNTPELIKYYKEERGISLEKIKDNRLGFTGEYLTIPLFEKNKLVNMIYRWNPLKTRPKGKAKYFLKAKCKNILFNIEEIHENKPVFLTEGVLDAIRLMEEGYENVVANTMGATTFLTEWRDNFSNIQEVIIVYDNDDAGRTGISTVSKKIGPEKCSYVELPVKDITEFFQSGKTKDDFDKLLENKQAIPDKEIKHLSFYKQETLDYLKNGAVQGILSGIPEIDHFLNGFKNGNLYILSAQPGVGKTALALNMAYNMSGYGSPCFFFSLEMPPIEIVQRYITIMLDITSTDMETGLSKEKLTEIEDLFGRIEQENPIYLYEGESGVKVKSMKDLIQRAIETKGIKCVFIDHLHYFSTNIQHTTSEIASITRTLRSISKDLDIPIILIAHLNRTGKRLAGKNFYIPNIIDLKDSSGLEQDSYAIIFIARDMENPDKLMRSKVVFKIGKNRGGATGMAQAIYHEEKLLFGSIKTGDPYNIDVDGLNKTESKISGDEYQEGIEY